MELTSTSFHNNELIPAKYTCDGENISPPLSWSGAPEETKSFAFICADPDAPRRTFVHWIVYNIRAQMNAMQEGAVPDGAQQAKNDFHTQSYGGPCPPSGTHRYFFTLYALDVPEINGNTASGVVQTVEQHTIAKAELIGLYQRARN